MIVYGDAVLMYSFGFFLIFLDKIGKKYIALKIFRKNI